MSSVAAIATPWPCAPGAHAALTARNAVLLLKVESNRLVENAEQSSKFHAPIGGPLDAPGATASAAVDIPMADAALGGTCCSGSSCSSACSSDCSSAVSDWHPPAGVHSTIRGTTIDKRLRCIESPFGTIHSRRTRPSRHD